MLVNEISETVRVRACVTHSITVQAEARNDVKSNKHGAPVGYDQLPVASQDILEDISCMKE